VAGGLGALTVTGLAGCGGDSGGSGQNAGGSGSGGQWYTPDGERLTINVKAPSNGTWPLNAQTAVQTLSAFGIDSSAVLRESAAYGDDINNSNFGMAINVWGGAQTRHPYSFYSTIFSSSNVRTGNFEPTAMEVPMPIGDPNGSTETVDVQAKIEALGSAGSDEQGPIIEELAWIYNQTLPRLPLMSGVARRWLTDDDWNLPPKDSEYMRDNPVNMVLAHAKVSAKSGSDDTNFQIAMSNSNPTDIQWNPFFVQASRRAPTNFMFEELWNNQAPANSVDPEGISERTPLLGDSVEAGDGTITVTIRDDRTWTDGDPMTAEDVAVHLRLAKHLGQSTGNVWDSMTVTDDYTLEIEIGDRNPQLAMAVLLPTQTQVKRDTIFGDWVEEFEAATTDDERTSIQQKVVQKRVEEYESYSLWKIDDISSNRVLMVPHDGHPLSENVNFESLELVSLSNNQTRWQSFKEGRLDALTFATAPESIEESFPDHAVRLAFDQYIGDGIVFNHGEEPFDDRRVRKAIAFLINRWTNTHNAKDFVTTIEHPTGMTNGVNEEQLGEKLSNYQKYGYEETKTEKAAQLLKDAGYTRE
jgi:ABC-type transport system substrate-binding protein